MPKQDDGRKYLVTGANRGIGLAFARQLCRRGDRVIATARQPEKARDLAKLPVRVEQLDVADEKSIADLAAPRGGGAARRPDQQRRHRRSGRRGSGAFR